MAPGSRIAHLLPATPLHSRVSSFISLHNVHAALLLSHLTTTYSQIVVSPAEAWLHGWLSPGGYPPFKLYGVAGYLIIV